ncbi:MAG: hypothetical protein PF442_06035 [Desulfobulbaceae bacterium]|jgi:hypothetical protein|nr:hypothetical protein [Desulfobulbaceae bacterium]
MDLLQEKSEISSRIQSFIWDASADQFDAVARALFSFQYKHLEPLRSYCASLGITPENLETIGDIPAIGLNVCKETSFFAGSEPSRVFRTSGTSGKGRGSSCFAADDLEIMQTGILCNCRQQLFSDGLKTRFLMLVPSPLEAPDMIMAYGMKCIAAQWGLEPPFFAVHKGGFLGREAVSYIQQAITDQVPLTIIGGSFGFVNFIDGMQNKLPHLPLPRGSRLLDAGGFKGRSRELNRDDFTELTSHYFNVPKASCFNLYGLTELASQFYSKAGQVKQPPHWTKVRVCNPMTMQDVAEQEQGVAVLYDLANIARPFVILTDDLAVLHPNGFELIGRASGSAPRGCSLSLEEVR